MAPAIVFIDEIDSIGGRRGGTANDHSERQQTLNQLLVELDSGQGTSVIAMAATNRPDVLDPALIRQGRFDRTIELDLPDRPARLEILKLHAEGKRLARTPTSMDRRVDPRAVGRRARGGDERGGPAHSAARSADDHPVPARGGPRAGRHGHRGQARALRGGAAAGRLSRGGTRPRRPRTPAVEVTRSRSSAAAASSGPPGFRTRPTARCTAARC